LTRDRAEGYSFGAILQPKWGQDGSKTGRHDYRRTGQRKRAPNFGSAAANAKTMSTTAPA